MPYQQEISRQHKALFVFLLDQSYSMEEPLGGSDRRKMDQVATAVNGWLQDWVIRATTRAGIRDIADVAVIGYRTDMEANPIIETPLAGALAGKLLVSIPEVGENPARFEQRRHQFYDEETGEVMEAAVETPVWIEAKAEGGTPTCSALYKAYEIVEQWIGEHPHSFPPVIIHITDGESQEGDPRAYADPLRGLETEDGNVLLFNGHLAMNDADTIAFPSCREVLPDELAGQLFEMSSVLPARTYALAVAEGYTLQPGARGTVFNATADALTSFLEILTRFL